MTDTAEFTLIASIREALAGGGPGVQLGVGDDCAVLVPPTGALLVTTDTMVEDVHFRRAWTSFEAIGRKAAATNLSDVAAMGGVPRWATLAVSLPRGFARADFDALFGGVVARLRAAGATLVGGDITASPGPWVVTLTLLGEAPAGGPLRRDGARPGDDVWVAGVLGDAALALRLHLRGTPGPAGERPFAALHDPLPRVLLGAALGRAGCVHAAIDVSDGLVQDLGHVCRASGVAAEIEAERLPVSPGFAARAAELGGDPWALVAAGGEDYALLVTAPPEAAPTLEGLLAVAPGEGPLVRVGRLVAGPPEVRLTVDGRPHALPRGGWDHFG